MSTPPPAHPPLSPSSKQRSTLPPLQPRYSPPHYTTTTTFHPARHIQPSTSYHQAQPHVQYERLQPNIPNSVSLDRTSMYTMPREQAATADIGANSPVPSPPTLDITTLSHTSSAPSSRACTPGSRVFITPLNVHEKCPHKEFFSKHGMSELVAWLSDPDNAQRLYDPDKTVKNVAIYKEIAQFINEQASTRWDDIKVKGQIRQLRMFWDETKRTFCTPDAGDSIYSTMRKEIEEHNPSFFLLKDAMTKYYNAGRKTRHRAPVAPVVDNDIYGYSPMIDLSRSPTFADDASDQGSPRRKRARDSDEIDILGIVDKLISSNNSQQEDRVLDLLQELYQDLRVELNRAHQELKEVRKELDQTRMELHDKELEIINTKMLFMQEKFELQLQIQTLKNQQQKQST